MLRRSPSLSLAALAVLSLGAAGCAAPVALDAPAAERPTVSGTVSYPQRIALVPGVKLTVRLLDVSLVDAPAVTLGMYEHTTTGDQAPFAYTIAYAPAAIQPNHTYIVRADLRDRDGSLRWTTDTAVPVITNGHPTSDVALTLVQVRG